MEPRWTIRQLLLQSFGVMCSLDSVVLTIMLNSILPMELARFVKSDFPFHHLDLFSTLHRDMRSNCRNEPKLNYSALLLTMIFSMGEPMPITHLGNETRENPTNTDANTLNICRTTGFRFRSFSLGLGGTSARHGPGRSNSRPFRQSHSFVQPSVHQLGKYCDIRFEGENRCQNFHGKDSSPFEQRR